MLEPRFLTFHQAVTACAQQGFDGLAAYTAAQALLHDEYIDLLNHGFVDQAETICPLVWQPLVEQASQSFQADPSEAEAGQWYRISWIAAPQGRVNAPIRVSVQHQGQVCGVFSFEAESCNTQVVHWPRLPDLPNTPYTVQLQGLASLVYSIEAIRPTEVLAYQMFLASQGNWQQYRQQCALQQEAQASNLGMERIPYLVQTPDQVWGERLIHQGLGQNAHIEGVKRIANHLVIHGWVYDPLRTLRAVALSDLNNQTVLNLNPMLARFESPDVAEAFNLPRNGKRFAYRFIVSIDTDRLPSALFTNMLHVHFIHQQAVYSEALPTTQMLTSDLAGVHELMNVLGNHVADFDTCNHVLAPIFSSVAREQAAQPTHNHCEWFNLNDTPARLSVIVPLYGSTRFEITQIATLAALRFEGLEVIFAVDDPDIHADVLRNVKRQGTLFGLRCAVVYPGSNLGFAGINNFAAQYATAPSLLFLNSDCFLSNADTLIKALAWFNTPRAGKPAGALGFRLLYPGGNLQHDGMSNDCWADNPNFIVNLHPRIGQPPHQYPVGQADSQASLLTAACLLMPKAVFLELGGFNRSYLRGDFEDSDLCLKLINAGYALGLLQTHDIHHLERQTIVQQAPVPRQTITLVNSALYKQRWNSFIQKGLPKLEVVQP